MGEPPKRCRAAEIAEVERTAVVWLIGNSRKLDKLLRIAFDANKRR